MAPLLPTNPSHTPPTLPSNYLLRPVTISQAHQISARTKTVLSILCPSIEVLPDTKTATSGSGELLQNKDGNDNVKTKDEVTIVALTAPNTKAAGKLISIVEIVKRELETRKKASEVGSEAKSKGKGWYQYTQLKSVVQEVSREAKQKVKSVGDESKGGAAVAAVDDDDDDDAFEVMEPAKVSGKRKRDGEEVEKAGELEVRESATKKRAMPVLTVYLSTAPVKELRMAFGEQT